MSVVTSYDVLRYEIKKDLKEVLEKARGLLNSDTWGYDHMRKDYDIDVYMAIKKTHDMI